MRQVAHVVLEGCKAGDGLALELERRVAVGDALLCVREELDDRVTQPGERRLLGLLECAEIPIDLLTGHSGILESPRSGDQGVDQGPHGRDGRGGWRS